MSSWLLPALSFGLTALILWGLLRSGLAYGLAMDHPNERSLHTHPVPRIGGIVLVPVALVCAVLSSPRALMIESLALVLCLLSFADDRRGLPVAVRFGSHVAAALIFVFNIAGMSWWAMIPAFLTIAWMTNLYNFMDGANGLAGGMTLFGFGALGFAATSAEAHDLALLGWTLTAAAAGFLFFNFHPAKVFMGDAGSIPLGFLAGAIGVEGTARGIWPIWFPLLVFSPFIVDASITLLRRVLRREKVWQAHREHYYQRLVQLGWSHRRLASIEYVLMFLAALLAFWIKDASPGLQMAGLLGWLGLLGALMASVDRRWANARHGVSA